MRTIEFDDLCQLPGYKPFQKGDRKAFSDEEAADYIREGWAHDPETGERGELRPGPVRLNIHSVVGPTEVSAQIRSTGTPK